MEGKEKGKVQLPDFDNEKELFGTTDESVDDKNWGIPDELPKLKIQKDKEAEEKSDIAADEKGASVSEKEDSSETNPTTEEDDASSTEEISESEKDSSKEDSEEAGDGETDSAAGDNTQKEIDAFAEEERERIRKERREKRRRKKKRQMVLRKLSFALVVAAILGTGLFLAKDKINIQKEQRISSESTQAVANQDSQESSEAQKENTEETNATEAEVQESSGEDAVLEQAALLAAQYDYDAAINLLKTDGEYDSNADMQAAVKEYEEIKATCVSWPLEEVTHVFYHTLVKDTSKAFDDDYKAEGYNQVMTTIDEFNAITQSMYEKGYVMVSMRDMATANEDGTITRGEILLPPGKIPFVLSQDDVSYYHYMDGDGYATKLIVDEDGKIRNEYVEDDGSVSVGDYDMVPLIDRFVEAHPDFSYRGAKGVLALTGYNGILGYRTDISYETRPDDLDAVKVKYLEEHPDFDLEAERTAAKEVVEVMKANGWEFASHTWGHLNVYEISMERLQADTERFKENVDPLIGGTDMIIFAFGADLTEVDDYSGEKFEYLKSQGYNYFCNVDSSQYFVQIRDNYFRMGRRNLDGYRMYYNPEMVADLFDAEAVFDSGRPVPVAPMS